MKKLLLLSIHSILICSICFGQEKGESNLEFEAYLGEPKTTACNRALDSFDKFLETNYKDYQTNGQRTKAFLERIKADINIDTTWLIPNTNENKDILKEWESSGLRKDIWLYSKEEYDTIYDVASLLNRPEIPLDSLPEIDFIGLDLDLTDEDIEMFKNSDTTGYAQRKRLHEERMKNVLWYNEHGKFLFALAKFAIQDSMVYKYVSAKERMGNISPVLVASGLLEDVKDFNDPFLKKILVSEFYFFILRWDIKRQMNK